MKQAIVALFLLLMAGGNAAAEPSKRELLHHMLAAMGTDLPDDAPQLAAYEQHLSEADMKAAIAFFESPAGTHLAAATQELARSAMAGLESAVQRSKQKRTAADLRTLAVSVEAYAIDHDDLYPPTSDLDQLAKLVTPTYLRSMVRLDGWGKEYIYISDTQHYRILSAGADGRLSRDSQRLGVRTGDFGDDLIFEDGEFVQPAQPME
ncbi:MAG TPA: DUF2059 domain-containing protein [Thermoanaerobaculia bacterium]|nr:DUF2059 domain-containing protein [Thermoanaerobaculia bacterium]